MNEYVLRRNEYCGSSHDELQGWWCGGSKVHSDLGLKGLLRSTGLMRAGHEMITWNFTVTSITHDAVMSTGCSTRIGKRCQL